MEESTPIASERISRHRYRRMAYYGAIFSGFFCIVSCFVLAALTYALFNDCDDCSGDSSKSILVKSLRILATGLFLVGVVAIVMSLCCRHSERADLSTVVSEIPDFSLEKTPASTLNHDGSRSHRRPEWPLLPVSHCDLVDYGDRREGLTPPPTYEEAINLQWQFVDLHAADGDKTPLSKETSLWCHFRLGDKVFRFTRRKQFSRPVKQLPTFSSLQVRCYIIWTRTFLMSRAAKYQRTFMDRYWMTSIEVQFGLGNICGKWFQSTWETVTADSVINLL